MNDRNMALEALKTAKRDYEIVAENEYELYVGLLGSIEQVDAAITALEAEAVQPSDQRHPLTSLVGWLNMQATMWEINGTPSDNEDVRAVRKWADAVLALIAQLAAPRSAP